MFTAKSDGKLILQIGQHFGKVIVKSSVTPFLTYSSQQSNFWATLYLHTINLEAIQKHIFLCLLDKIVQHLIRSLEAVDTPSGYIPTHDSVEIFNHSYFYVKTIIQTK